MMLFKGMDDEETEVLPEALRWMFRWSQNWQLFLNL